MTVPPLLSCVIVDNKAINEYELTMKRNNNCDNDVKEVNKCK